MIPEFLCNFSYNYEVANRIDHFKAASIFARLARTAEAQSKLRGSKACLDRTLMIAYGFDHPGVRS
jgi:hypothetical protein